MGPAVNVGSAQTTTGCRVPGQTNSAPTSSRQGRAEQRTRGVGASLGLTREQAGASNLGGRGLGEELRIAQPQPAFAARAVVPVDLGVTPRRTPAGGACPGIGMRATRLRWRSDTQRRPTQQQRQRRKHHPNGRTGRDRRCRGDDRVGITGPPGGEQITGGQGSGGDHVAGGSAVARAGHRKPDQSGVLDAAPTVGRSVQHAAGKCGADDTLFGRERRDRVHSHHCRWRAPLAQPEHDARWRARRRTRRRSRPSGHRRSLARARRGPHGRRRAHCRCRRNASPAGRRRRPVPRCGRTGQPC